MRLQHGPLRRAQRALDDDQGRAQPRRMLFGRPVEPPAAEQGRLTSQQEFEGGERVLDIEDTLGLALLDNHAVLATLKVRTLDLM